MALLQRSSIAVGLDIGSFNVRGAELLNGKPPLLSHLGSAPLPQGAVVDGEIMEIDPVSDALRELWATHKFRQKRVTVGVANHKVLVRQLELPNMSSAELQGAVAYQAQELIPIQAKDLVLDYQIVGEYVNDEDQRMLNLLLVAAPRETIERFVLAIEGAGLQPWVIYVSSLALVRSLAGGNGHNGSEHEDPARELPEVLLNMSASTCNLVVVERGQPRFARMVPFGGNDFTDAVALATGLQFEEAEEVKKGLGLPYPEGVELESEQERLAGEALSKQAYKLVDEVRRSIEYYFGQELLSGSIDRLTISGAAASMANLDVFLKDALQIGVEKGRPLQKIRVHEQLLSSPELTQHEPSLAVCVGLALRGLD